MTEPVAWLLDKGSIKQITRFPIDPELFERNGYTVTPLGPLVRSMPSGTEGLAPSSADRADLAALAEETGLSLAVLDVIAERVRQVCDLGYTAEHDDVHTDGSLSEAAAVYVLDALDYGTQETGNLGIWNSWGVAWHKPKGLRADLVRAAALLIADIERLDRAEVQALKAVTP
jgi:hypothetical protein